MLYVQTMVHGKKRTIRYVQLVQRLRKNVVPAGRISTYHSLHIQYLQKKLLWMDRYGPKHVQLTPEHQ